MTEQIYLVFTTCIIFPLYRFSVAEIWYNIFFYSIIIILQLVLHKPTEVSLSTGILSRSEGILSCYIFTLASSGGVIVVRLNSDLYTSSVLNWVFYEKQKHLRQRFSNSPTHVILSNSTWGNALVIVQHTLYWDSFQVFQQLSRYSAVSAIVATPTVPMELCVTIVDDCCNFIWDK